MAVVIGAIIDNWSDRARENVVGSLTFSGNYTTGGDAIVWQLGTQIKSSRPPVAVDISGKAGYLYAWDSVNNKIMVFQSAAAGSPFGQITGGAAYPAGVTADVVTFQAIFKKNV